MWCAFGKPERKIPLDVRPSKFANRRLTSAEATQYPAHQRAAQRPPDGADDGFHRRFRHGLAASHLASTRAGLRFAAEEIGQPPTARAIGTGLLRRLRFGLCLRRLLLQKLIKLVYAILMKF